MRVLEELCARPSVETARIVVESELSGANAITELLSDPCRKLALVHAATKMAMFRPGIQDHVHVYAVDANGADVLDPKLQVVKAYRAELNVRQAMVL